jgi:competence protein ComEC
LLVFCWRLAADQGDNLLRLHFIDVGQGDAIWIQGPAGDSTPSVNMIVDGGPDTGAGNRLLTYLQKYHLSKGAMIDYVISTHPHDDHYPGLLDVLANYEVRTIIDPGFPVDGPKFQKFVKAAKAETVKGKKSEFILLRDKPDFQLRLGEGVDTRILYSDNAALKDMGSGNSRVNNASTVIRIAFGSFSFLLMGDAEGKERPQPPETLRYVEKFLLGKFRPEELHSTVLKAGHHGSETCSTLPFIRAVQPDVVVIMSGRKAFSGTYLPDKTVLARYKQERPGVTIVRTDEQDEQQGLDTTNDADGDDILIFTDGDSLQVQQSQGPVNHRRWVKIRTIQK